MTMKQFIVDALVTWLIVGGIWGYSKLKEKLAERPHEVRVMAYFLMREREAVGVMRCTDPLIFYPDLFSVQSRFLPNKTEEDMIRGVVKDNPEIFGLPGACYVPSPFLVTSLLSIDEKSKKRQR